MRRGMALWWQCDGVVSFAAAAFLLSHRHVVEVLVCVGGVFDRRDASEKFLVRHRARLYMVFERGWARGREGDRGGASVLAIDCGRRQQRGGRRAGGLHCGLTRLSGARV